MCGICGLVNFNDRSGSEEQVSIMLKTLRHRGPDDEGKFFGDNIAIGFVRLSIIDLTNDGHQPMFSEDGNLVMVFNGEIYNYIELRDELISTGHNFKSKSDSEVLLKAYIEWGEDCLNKFNGMWSFAIYDRKEKKIFAARDRYGIKPFYYYTDNNCFIFCSEIPPILKVLPDPPVPDDQAVYDFLVYNRTDHSQKTFFKDIVKLQHGHSLSLSDNGTLKIRKWYDLKASLKEPFASPEEFREMLVSSIKMRLRSDVPVGVCLSGGLDSSSIVSILLNDFQKKDLCTFSAVYNHGQHGDESEYIAEYKGILKNSFFINPSAETLHRDLNEFVHAQGEPVPTASPYAQFLVMKLAGEKVVVTLDGQGADEVIAGYHYFFGVFFKELLLKGNYLKLVKEVFSYLRTHHSTYALKTFAFYLISAGLKSGFRQRGINYLNPNFRLKYRYNNPLEKSLYSPGTLQESLLEHFEYKLEHLLKWEDRNSMHHSLEARVPFLDYRIVERSLSLPVDCLINKGTTKVILREAMKGILPEKIRIRQDKIGFGVPQNEWLKSEAFRGLINDLLSSESFKNRKIIDATKAAKIYKNYLDGRTDASREVWKWISLELWYRAFIDNKNP